MDRSKVCLLLEEKLETFPTIGRIGILRERCLERALLLGEICKINPLPLKEGQKIIPGLGFYTNIRQRSFDSGAVTINSLLSKINYK